MTRITPKNISHSSRLYRVALCVALAVASSAGSITLSGCVTNQTRAETPGSNSTEAKTEELLRAQKQSQRREDAALRREQANIAAAKQGSNASGDSEPTSIAPVLALLEQAKEKQHQGKQGRANLLLERALRIDPADPATYLALAELRLETLNYSQAIAFAKKGLANNPGPALNKQLVEVIREATEQQSPLTDS